MSDQFFYLQGCGGHVTNNMLTIKGEKKVEKEEEKGDYYYSEVN